MKQTRIHCPYCGSLATLRPASVIHGLSDISAGTYLYVCRRWPACDAYVTADRRTKQPLGTLANGDLRHKRILAHHALHSVQAQLGMNRDQSYRWLQTQMGCPEIRYISPSAATTAASRSSASARMRLRGDGYEMREKAHSCPAALGGRKSAYCGARLAV